MKAEQSDSLEPSAIPAVFRLALGGPLLDENSSQVNCGKLDAVEQHSLKRVTR